MFLPKCNTLFGAFVTILWLREWTFTKDFELLYFLTHFSIFGTRMLIIYFYFAILPRKCGDSLVFPLQRCSPRQLLCSIYSYSFQNSVRRIQSALRKFSPFFGPFGWHEMILSSATNPMWQNCSWLTLYITSIAIFPASFLLMIFCPLLPLET